MGQVLHGSAKTTRAIRGELQRSQASLWRNSRWADMRLFDGLPATLAVPTLQGGQSDGDPAKAFEPVLIGILISALHTPIARFPNPPDVHALEVGFPCAVGNVLFGGALQYVALQLRPAGIERAYCYYVTAVSFIGFAFAMLMRRFARLRVSR